MGTYLKVLEEAQQSMIDGIQLQMHEHFQQTELERTLTAEVPLSFNHNHVLYLGKAWQFINDI